MGDESRANVAAAAGYEDGLCHCERDLGRKDADEGYKTLLQSLVYDKLSLHTSPFHGTCALFISSLAGTQQAITTLSSGLSGLVQVHCSYFQASRILSHSCGYWTAARKTREWTSPAALSRQAVTQFAWILSTSLTSNDRDTESGAF